MCTVACGRAVFFCEFETFGGRGVTGITTPSVVGKLERYRTVRCLQGVDIQVPLGLRLMG